MKKDKKPLSDKELVGLLISNVKGNRNFKPQVAELLARLQKGNDAQQLVKQISELSWNPND